MSGAFPENCCCFASRLHTQITRIVEVWHDSLEYRSFFKPLKVVEVISVNLGSFAYLEGFILEIPDKKEFGGKSIL